jgi:hypothetical protein
LALAQDGALEEARRAADFLKSHAPAYGSLPKVPFPLAVFRLPRSAEDSLLAAYETALSERALAGAKARVRSGLAVYAYFLPGSPLRVQFARGGEGEGKRISTYRESLEALRQAGHDPEKTLEDWLRLAARMLLLGNLPARVEDPLIGGCLMPQNATMDGGFCDVASLRPLADVKDEKELFDSLGQLLAFLSLLAGTYLLTTELTRVPMQLHRGWHFNRWPSRYGFGHLMVDRYVRERLTFLFAAERRPGAAVDPRLERFFARDFGYGGLSEALAGIYPSLDLPAVGAVGQWLRAFLE